MTSPIYSFDIWPVGLALLVLPLAVMAARKRSPYRIATALVFGVYLVYAAQQVWFPLQFGPGMATRRSLQISPDFNLIPFAFGRFGTLRGSLRTLALNVLLTVPFGFGLNFVSRVRAKHFWWIALGVGLGLEAVQLASLPFQPPPYRTIDVNDVLMNALGVLIGYALFRVFSWAVVQTVPEQRGSLWGYLYNVAARVGAYAP